MCTGAVANIVLDWLFIFPLQWGVIGAAVASGLGQVSSCLILMTHFIRRKGDLRIRKFPLNLSLMGKICTYGLPESASQLTTPVTTFCYNTVLASMIGDLAVSTFSVLSFIFSLVNAILSGVVQGMQPLWGRSYGMKDDKGLRYYLGQSSDAEINSTNQSVTVTPANRGPCKNFCSLLYPVLLIMGICILLLSPLFATLYRNEIFEACGSAYTNAYLYLREWPILGIVLFGTGITAVGLGGVIAKYLKRRQF